MKRGLLICALVAPLLAVPSAPAQAASCATPATKKFVPTRISVTHAAKGAVVYARARDSRGVPGTPPLTAKNAFAWDAPGAKPGARRGNIMLNAHTWPDGSALGNRLNNQLKVGGKIKVKGSAGQLICYRVVKRVEIHEGDVAFIRKVYNFTGKSRVVLITCSGTRLGPGHWSHRTIWFARP